MPPLSTTIPFLGVLLSIALAPLLIPAFWHKYDNTILIIWTMMSTWLCFDSIGGNATGHLVSGILFKEYLPFIILIGALYIISSGIHIRINKSGTTGVNVAILLVGELLSNLIGTTGTSMLLLRPMLEVNKARKYKVHTVIFFIFLVSNIGGCLLPFGDPPLFLGYLKGVNFLWTAKHMFPLFLVISTTLILVYVVLDKWFLRRECNQANDGQKEDAGLCNTKNVASSWKMGVEIGGYLDIALMIVVAVLVAGAGLLSKKEAFSVFGTSVHYKGLFRDVGLILISVVSIVYRRRTLRRSKHLHEGEGAAHNLSEHSHDAGSGAGEHLHGGAGYCIGEHAHGDSYEAGHSAGEHLHGHKISWAPLSEVARYFIAIFITMAPIAVMLKGGHEFFVPIRNMLGSTAHAPFWYFWFVSPFSAFLDNAPTYVVFFKMAGGDALALMTEHSRILTAISAGSVFMGAMTYIGNAPNFMVTSIAKQYGVHMPSFFGYMAWSCAILLPVMIAVSYFFLY
jgi:Na+/H+ antiporter NhaD/arsenite permease-like protein